MKKAFVGSLVLAILHSILFYGQDLGISVMLFIIPLLFFMIDILTEKAKIKNTKALLLSIPIILLSITYFIFNNTFFCFFNMIVIIILFIIMIVLSVFEENRVSQIISRFFSTIGKPFEKIEEVIQITVNELFVKEEQNCKEKEKKYKNIKKIVLGVIISIPILVIVILLLSSADSVFAKGIEGITNGICQIFQYMTIREIIFRIALILMITIYGVAFIYNLIESDQENEEESKTRKITVDNIIINTILTILNLVYTVFCYIQIVNLFMGYSSLSETEYANYARQGFFQLMAVSIINLAIILITTHNEEKGTKFQRNYTKMMNFLLAIFTLIILVSSFMRMYLYEQTFGYTFLRLMVYIILITEAILIVPTIMHIFNKEVKLMKPYFIIILTMYVLVNYINIDNMIAKRNIDRYFNEPNVLNREIDFAYLETTGIDGTVQIKRLLNAEDKNLQIMANNYLFRQKNKVKEMNLQEFNINKYRLNKELEEIQYKLDI